MNNAATPLPTGTVTLLFTDLERSTLLWERHGEQMRPALARHDALLRTAVKEYGGHVVKTTGDGLLAVFVTAASALVAALDAQRRLHAGDWSEITPDALRVRVGLHSGEAELRDGNYYGSAVNRAARIMSLGHDGQLLLSAVTSSLLEDVLPPQLNLRDMGSHPLRGLSRDEQIYQLVAPNLVSDFPPLRSGKAPAGNLPAHVSGFIGRTREMAEVRSALLRTRLLTLTGPGGTGKTRLSLQVAADVQQEFEHGARLVELAPVIDPDLVVTTVAAVFGLNGQTSEQLGEMLVGHMRDKELLLILDNARPSAVGSISSRPVRGWPPI
jgi:class 3 adenylate cyclase